MNVIIRDFMKSYRNTAVKNVRSLETPIFFFVFFFFMKCDAFSGIHLGEN